MRGWNVVFPGAALVAAACQAQITPAHPERFMSRPVGGAASGGIQVLPGGQGKAETVRHVTHIVLSTNRLWTNPEGKIIEGKLIAFEDLIAEAPLGAEAPPHPAPPEFPTVVRDGRIRLLVKGKPVITALSRFSAGDVEFVEQVRKAYAPREAARP